MSQTPSYDTMKHRARQYFERASFVAPAFVDDQTLVFLDDRSGTMQVSMVDTLSGEVTSLTSFSERVQSVIASPASGRIVFGMDAGGNERQQLYTLTREGTHTRITSDDGAIHDPGCLSKDGEYVLIKTNTRSFGTFDIQGMALEGGPMDMWLQDGGQVQALAIDAAGDRALVVRMELNQDNNLLLVDRSGETVNLTEHEGEQRINGAAFDPDGRRAWMLSCIERDFDALIAIDLETRLRTVAIDAEWDVELFAISPDGATIAVAINENGRSRLSLRPRAEIGTVTDVELPVGVIDQLSWSPDSSRIAFGFSTVETPSVIMSAALDGSTTVVAAAEHDAPPTVSAEPITYTSFDGLEIPAYWLTPDGDGPFPVLIDIHGGPEGQRRPDYRPSGPVLQYIVSLGIAVLSLNVRGSTGYGKSYSHLDDTYKRMDSVKDVDYAVRWLRARDDVIGDRIAVYGRSYGGFMVLACMVEYPEMWAAGVEFVGISNFVSFLERTSEWRRRHREAEYGSLEHDRDMLWDISPLRRIDRIAAPLMVCHGRNDVRVPLFETEQVVDAVKANGQDVLFRIYDDEGHAMTKLPNILDAFANMGIFLTEHLQGESRV